eukprot:162620_1
MKELNQYKYKYFDGASWDNFHGVGKVWTIGTNIASLGVNLLLRPNVTYLFGHTYRTECPFGETIIEVEIRDEINQGGGGYKILKGGPKHNFVEHCYWKENNGNSFRYKGKLKYKLQKDLESAKNKQKNKQKQRQKEKQKETETLCKLQKDRIT